MRNETVLKLNLCGEYLTLTDVELRGEIYFDCLRYPPKEIDIGRPRKSYDDYGTVVYDEKGVYFNKEFLYVYKNDDEPLFLYYYDNSTISEEKISSKDDSCTGKPKNLNNNSNTLFTAMEMRNQSYGSNGTISLNNTKYTTT